MRVPPFIIYLIIFSILMGFVTFFYFFYKINKKWEDSFEVPGCLSGVCCIIGIVFFLAGFVSLCAALIEFLS